jgi:predicted GIY-YIG superfamily endonuclease
MFCVYRLQNDRGQLYFGKTNNPKDRWKHHRNGNAKCTSGILWEDGGIVNDIEVLEWFDTEELALQREKELIRNNNCVNIRGKYTRQELNKRFYYKDHAATLEKRRLYDQTEERKQKKRETNRKYHEKNKEKANLQGRQRYEKNKEKISARQKEKIKCTNCGVMWARGNMSNHKKTPKCKSFSECD